MEVMLSEDDNKETICIPLSILDPEGKKMGQKVSCKVSGIIKSIGEHGVTIEIGDGNEEEDMDEFENDSPDEQTKKVKKQWDSKNKLEEY